MNVLFKLLLFLSLTKMLTNCSGPVSFSAFQEQEYVHLERILAETKVNLSHYLSATKAHARSICADGAMTSFFLAKRDYYALKRDTALPETFEQEIVKLKQKIQYHYLVNYANFHDILFVDTTGDIFYTIRKQEDYHQNIFQGDLAKTSLSKNLRAKKGESYIDFQFYAATGGPSAFFVEPLIVGGQTQGWFVLQCSVDKINHIFKRNDLLGKTGEVLLVNRNHYLLTDSRFTVHSSILKQKLPKDNIESKFQLGHGRKCVVDYRHKQVMSAFETFSFFGTDWLMIAKMDRDEVLTSFYTAYEDSQYPVLETMIKRQRVPCQDSVMLDKDVMHAEMDDYARADTAEIVFTQGVSTCTAVAMLYPGRFTYLAHISPYDAVYGEDRTDITGRMLQQVTHFDITGSEKEQLQFHVVATRSLALKNLVHTLLAEGYFLSQIHVLFNSGAEYANVYSTSTRGRSYAYWNNSGQPICVSNSDDFASLSTLLETTHGFLQ